MGVFKEEAFTFEQIAKNQKRIYYDALDYGYPYNTSNPPSEITTVINTIKELQALDKKLPDEKRMIRNRETWHNGVSVTIRIGWEIDEGYERGTQYIISFNKTDSYTNKIEKQFNAFLSIDIKSYKEKP